MPGDLPQAWCQARRLPGLPSVPCLRSGRSMIHSYPWYITDWRESEAVLTMTIEQRGLYRELLDMCWREGSLPTEERTLRKLAMAEQAEFDKCWPVVKTQFTERDGRLWNAKVDEKRPEVLKSKEDRSRGGKIRAESAPRKKGRFLPDRTSSAGRELPACDQLSTSSAPAEHPADDQPPPSPSMQLAPSPLPGVSDSIVPSRHKLHIEKSENDFSLSSNSANSGKNGRKPKGDSDMPGYLVQGFDEWWAIYPRKEAKPQARKAYAKYRVSGVEHEKIMAAQSRCNPDLLTREVGFRPQPSSWLHQEHWLDETSPETLKRPEDLDELDRLRPPPLALPDPGAKYAK